MKVVSTEALTKLIQLIKSSFISVDDTEQTSEIETETPNEVTLATVATTGDYDDLTNTPTVYHPDLLSFQWSDHLLNNVSWLRADTFSWQDGTVYEAAYEHLTDDITGITPTTETVGSNTITVYVASDGHKIVLEDQAQTVQDIYDETGVAWYFILDTTNQRFKLPRTKFGLTGLRDSVGKYVQESLPNIKGLFTQTDSQVGTYNAFASGALYMTEEARGYMFGRMNGSQSKGDLGFDASRSSSTYQDNAPVQPPATQMYLYFYVGDYTQTAIEQTAGLNSELFNEKLDVSTPHIVETYHSGSSWYRVYSDGWCEQGGVIASVLSNTYTAATVNLLQPFANTDYTCLITQDDNSQTLGLAEATNGNSVHSKSTSSFVIACYSWTYGRSWYTCGYIS